MLEEKPSRKMFELMGIDIEDLSKDRQWTQDGVSYLIDLYRLGWTVDDIADEMGRTPGNIVGKIYDLGEKEILRLDMWGSDCKGKQFTKGHMGDVVAAIV